MTANQRMREHWNAPGQVESWPKRERVSTAITAPLIERLAPREGERVLDIGSGGGLASLAAARAVGPRGAVTGFDLSAGLTQLAAQRAADAGAANTRFHAGDAQVDDIPGGPFDAAMSQFGVMFFDDPVAAFGNIRRHLRPGGRLAFACWQAAPKNTWYGGAALAKYVEQPPAAAADRPPPGPFAFADAAYVGMVLTAAGFAGVRGEEIECDVTAPEASLYERGMLTSMNIDPARHDDAWRELMAVVEPMRVGDGQVRLRLAAQIFSATNE